MKNSLRMTLFIFSTGILIYSLVSILGKEYSYINDDIHYENLRKQVVQTNYVDSPIVLPTTRSLRSALPEVKAKPYIYTPYTLISGNPDDLNADGILNEYSNLYEQNNELIGWIQIPGFKKPLDYPIMQTKDNEFYLNHDFNKKTSKAGAIFMDYANNPQDDKNLIIYGHAMRNKTMFGNLNDYYVNPEEYTKLIKIYLNLMNMRLEFEVFSTYAENMDYNYRQINFSNDAEYLEFLQKIQSKSVYDYQVELTPEDRILTLSTCNHIIDSDYRSVIHAKLVKKVFYK